MAASCPGWEVQLDSEPFTGKMTQTISPRWGSQSEPEEAVPGGPATPCLSCLSGRRRDLVEGTAETIPARGLAWTPPCFGGYLEAHAGTWTPRASYIQERTLVQRKRQQAPHPGPTLLLGRLT